MPRYAIIENTPGYLPEDEDPPVFDTWRDALTHLYDYRNELLGREDARDYIIHPIDPDAGEFPYVRKGENQLPRFVCIEAWPEPDDDRRG